MSSKWYDRDGDEWTALAPTAVIVTISMVNTTLCYWTTAR